MSWGIPILGNLHVGLLCDYTQFSWIEQCDTLSFRIRAILKLFSVDGFKYCRKDHFGVIFLGSSDGKFDSCTWRNRHLFRLLNDTWPIHPTGKLITLAFAYKFFF